MEALNSACAVQSFKSFRELEQGEYIVNKFSKASTNHGERIRIDCAGFYMLLPERFAQTLTDEVIAELNKSPKVMAYSGKDVSNRNRLILHFKEFTYFTEMLGDNTEFFT